jgi:hypothetical protein
MTPFSPGDHTRPVITPGRSDGGPGRQTGADARLSNVKIRALRPLHQADLSNDVVHFTDRWGKANDEVPDEILELDARQRLGTILKDGRIRSFQTFFTCGLPVVCFTEATREGLRALIQGTPRRYVPWGIGFSKDFIFRNGGGPAYYVRGDDWDAFAGSDLPDIVKAFGTMFWPGVDLEPGDNVPDTLTKKNEWAHEREWRVPFKDDGAALKFRHSDVSTIVAPSLDTWRDLVKELALERELAHVGVIDIAGEEKPPAQPATEFIEIPDEIYDDPRMRRLLGLPPRSIEDLEDDLGG